MARTSGPIFKKIVPAKAIIVTDQAIGTTGIKLSDRSEPVAAINDFIAQIHASGFVGTELAWPSTWTYRQGLDRTPSITGQEQSPFSSAASDGCRWDRE